MYLVENCMASQDIQKELRELVRIRSSTSAHGSANSGHACSFNHVLGTRTESEEGLCHYSSYVLPCPANRLFVR